jgi:hypothetical protein
MALFLPLRAQAITITPVDFDGTYSGGSPACADGCPEYSFGEVTVGEIGIRTVSFDVTCTADDYYCTFVGLPIPPGYDIQTVAAITPPVDCRLCGQFDTATGRWAIDYSLAPRNAGPTNPILDAIGVFDSTLRSGLQQYFVLTGTGVAAPVPIPPALWLFGSGLLGLVGVARRRARA